MKGYSLGRTQPIHTTAGWTLPLFMLGLLVLMPDLSPGRGTEQKRKVDQQPFEKIPQALVKVLNEHNGKNVHEK